MSGERCDAIIWIFGQPHYCCQRRDHPMEHLTYSGSTFIGNTIVSTPKTSSGLALTECDVLRSELDGLRVRTLTLDQRCRDAATTLLGVGAALARMGWLALDDDLSDQSHDNLLGYVRTIKGVYDLLSIGEAERQEKARIERRESARASRVAGETGDTP